MSFDSRFDTGPNITEFSLVCRYCRHEPEHLMPDLLLIVEDSPVMRHVLKRIMSRSLWQKDQILEASNGAEGLVLARTPGVCLVLTDIRMPVMGGLELLQRMQEDERLRHVPVMIVTAVTTCAAEMKARELGAAGYIRKPFDPDQITGEVMRVLAAARRSRLVAPAPVEQPAFCATRREAKGTLV